MSAAVWTPDETDASPMETPMRRFPLMLALTALTMATLARAQQQGQLFISVLDADNMPVTDLEPADISVVVDDVDCRVVKLEPVSKTMKVTLMVDNGPVLTKELATYR